MVPKMSTSFAVSNMSRAHVHSITLPYPYSQIHIKAIENEKLIGPSPVLHSCTQKEFDTP